LRVRNRIFYYFLLFLIIAYASFNLIQKALISPIIRDNIVSKVGPAVRADNFDIRQIVIGLGGLDLKDVVYEKENVKIVIKVLTIDFSLMESLRNLFRPDEKFFKARSVVLNGCDITINPETRPDSRTKWKFEYDDFQKITGISKRIRLCEVHKDQRCESVIHFGFRIKADKRNERIGRVRRK